MAIVPGRKEWNDGLRTRNFFPGLTVSFSGIVGFPILVHGDSEAPRALTGQMPVA